MFSRLRWGNGLLKFAADGTDGVEYDEFVVFIVWRRALRCSPSVISIGLISEDRSRSSLLSDCTRGLVGAFKTKLEDRDEDMEGARYRRSKELTSSVDAKCDSLWNGDKLLEGVLESHRGGSEL